MDKLEFYRQAIETLLTNYVAIPISNGEIESYTVFDRQQDRYLVMNVGWNGYRRVHGCVLHFDIKGGKIWLQQNMTERRVACELVEMGVLKTDIVLGFQAPELREYTDFAVG